MRNELTIRFSGEQGSGVQLAGQLAADSIAKLGYNLFAVNDFESRIRGGYSFVQFRLGISEVYSIKRSPDIVIPFSKSAVERDISTVNDDTYMFVSKDFIPEVISSRNKLYPIDIDKLLKDKKFVNIFFVSFLMSIIKVDIEPLREILKKTLSKKGVEVVNANIESLDFGYKCGSSFDIEALTIDKAIHKEAFSSASLGSFAISAGAAVSNCKFYSAYPMSPSTSIINNLAEWAEDFGIVVEQCEDEISVLNMALGASYAGVRAMIGTSGGGLALMSEAVSLAAIAEVPIVIVNAQRPGPATGLPTSTEQADLLFTLFMGHGEFTKIVFAPGTHEKAFELVQKGFYLADKYQVPVFILTDQYIMDSIKTCKKWEIIKQYQERFIDKGEDNNEGYLRYKFTDNGVSPRKIPGMTNTAVVSDSHTHDESGYITEDPYTRDKNVEKLLIKNDGILKDIAVPYILSPDEKEYIVIGWGSTFGVIFDAVNLLNKEGYSINHIHFHEVYPLDVVLLQKILKGKRLISVENNATAQFAKLLRMETGISVEEKIVKYNGRAFYLDELARLLKEKIYVRA